MKNTTPTTLPRAAVLLAAFSVMGCAPLVYEGKYDWRDGWREGVVVQRGTAAELGGRQFSDCRYREGTEQVSAAFFVVVAYERMNRTRRRVVPLHPGEVYRPGDLVYMNLGSCETPIATRSSRRY